MNLRLPIICVALVLCGAAGATAQTAATDEIIQTIMEKGHRKSEKIVFEKDPKILIQKVLELVKKDKKEYFKVYNNHDGFSDTCIGNACQVAL